MHDRVVSRVTRSGTVSLNDFDIERQAAIEQAIRDVVSAPDYAPPTLRRAAMEVIALAQRPEVSFQELEAVMKSDPLLAGRVLRRAQSPMFSGGGAMHSLRDALVRLGITGIRNLVIEESMRQRVFRAGIYQPLVESTADHAMHIAIAASSVARYTSFPTDYLYLLGLMHDVGVGLALSAIVDKLPRELHPQVAMVSAYVAGIHEELGESLTKAWGLPSEVSLIVAHHHQPVIAGYAHPLACVLIVAEQIVATAGSTAPWDTRPPLTSFAMTTLQLSESQIKLATQDYTTALRG